ncbi:hypothetical protein K7432_009829 [Basidiobolus ranarum]|uniref:Uncharacterized protein n=1 Tax=Basidiobolus ranarum TaxID=34480 RepID=A0ABR2VWL2_9FUNG
MFKQPFDISKTSSSPIDLQNPDSEVDVGRTIRAMDEQYGTQFETWIRNENNIDCVVFYLRKFILEFEDTNPSAISRAVKWIVEGWSVHKSAELLIKLLYHWGIGHAKFVSLVSELSQNWRMPLVVDLVATLVIGETSSNASSFIHHFTQTWEPFMIIQLCRNVATRLRWNDRYCHQFLLRYASLTYPEGPTQREMLNQIQQQFETRSRMLHHFYNPSKVSSSCLPLSPVDFTMSVLEVMVRDHKVYLSNHLKSATLSGCKVHHPNNRIESPKHLKAYSHNNDLVKSQYEEVQEIPSNRPCPRSSSLLEKLNGPSPASPADGRNFGLHGVNE